MLAIIAVVCFVIALLLDWTSTTGGTLFNPSTLMLLGLIFLSLHLAGVGAAYDWRTRASSYRRRRR